MLIYLHIPFCDSKCHYCGFNSYTSLHDLKEKYSIAMTEQLKHNLDFFSVKKQSISSFFIGGGTPSTLKAKYFKPFFDTLNPYLSKNAEITTEANPNSACLSWLEQMQELGINRISFGVQSFFEDKLKFLGRSHDKNQAIKAIQNAKSIGIENISIDLIYSTKFDSKERLQSEINQALSLPIKHLSAYSLTLEENTPFYGKENLLNKDFSLGNFIVKTLSKRGFNQYEVSSYGLTCKHNLGYWKHKPYLGIGAGAVGFDEKSRFYPKKNINEYLLNPLDYKEEKLTKEDLILEKIFLGLRSKIGIQKNILSLKQIQKADMLVKENKLTCKGDRYFSKDFFIADEVVLFLMNN